VLVIGDRVVQRFEERIAQLLDAPELDLTLVRTELVGRDRTPRNLWAFDRDGRSRWRAGGLGTWSRYEEVAVWSATRLVARVQNVGLVVLDAIDGAVVAVPQWWTTPPYGLM
jgi:hypothetical protein